MRLSVRIAVFVIAVFSFLFTNEINAQKSIVAKAVNSAVSLPVRDLPAVKGSGAQLGETNLKNRKVIRQVDMNAPGVKDGSLSSDPTNQKRTTPNIPNPPTVSFEGIPISETITLGQGFLPPDPTGDVGPNHYVQAVNSCFRVWDKTGAPLIPTTSLASLFGPLGLPPSALDDGDPIVIYDQLADRWLISEFCTITTPNNHQLIAISQTSDPTGAYYLYDFMMPNIKFNDYPKFGVWPDGYYMTDNQFNQAGTAFLGGGVFAFDRMKMLAGDPTASFIYFDLFTLDPTIGGMLPADLEGLTPPPAGAPCPFAYFIATEFGDASDGIRIFDFHADFAVPANSTFTERTGSPLSVAAFDPRTSPASRDVIPQPPPANPATNFLDAIGDRLMFRLAYRNFGSSESLVANHTVNADVFPVYRAGVRFYQLTRTSPAAAFTVAEQQTFAGAPGDLEDRWMGSVAINHQNDVAVGYSISSTTVFPSIRYAGRLGTDPAGTGLAQGEQNIIAGAGIQTNTSSRWGDYSQMAVDPVDDCSFWYTQEYYPVSSEPGNSTAPWHTRIAKMTVGTCTTSPRGTVSGTITDCNTGLPIQNAMITLSGGFFRSTDAAGNYSAFLPPGTYNISATATNYNTANGVVTITNGGNTIFNACLSGVPLLSIDQVNVTADDCNSNGSVDPNENVTISLGIINTGTINTTNLVATLQATGGVTNPSGPQNYGVVIAGGAVVFRSFTFTASDFPCGMPIVITVQLQDGAVNFGTISFNLATGSPGGPTNNYSTGDIATPIPDAATVNIPLVITDAIGISDVNVRIRLNHTFDGDLDIKLVHPDGTIVTLVDNRGGSGDNFGTGANSCSGTHTILDDEAGTAISAGTAPFSSTFRPESPLSAFDGKLATGTWFLRVADEAALDVGTVGCFQLDIESPICCTPAIISAGATLTAESCTTPAGGIDPGETVTVSFCVQNIGNANTTNLVGTLQATGGITSPGGPQNFGVVTFGGPPVCRPFTFTASGSCGGTITATIDLMDGSTNLGSVTYTFSLGATSTTVSTFSNPAQILVPGTGTSGPAAPYPSTINVAGLPGAVSNVRVTLTNMNHTFPDDIDILLVGPGGQRLILMSDAGGSADLVNNTYTFDDAAAGMLADGALNASGSYRPSNYGTGDTYPAPAPVGPYTDPQLLSVFDGTNPNGIWSLYVLDDVGGDVGSIDGGWLLELTTEEITCCVCSITCPANIVVGNDANQCGAVVNYPAPTTNCGPVSSNPPSGSFFPVGTTTVVATSAGGPTCSFTITVNDTQPPTVTCPANMTVSNTAGQCSAVVNFSVTASDNCPGVTLVSVPASGSIFPVGTTTVTSTATDVAGNTATCVFTITVNDTQAPVVTCPANITVSNALNQCGANVSFPAPTATDNCPGVLTVVTSPASGSFFPVGTTTVTATTTDAAGNTGNCTFTIRVNDTQPPVVTCPANITVSNSPGLCGANVSFSAAPPTDNCPGVTSSYSPASGSFFPVGTTTVTRTATDASGNTATCTFTVRVNDVENPVFGTNAPLPERLYYKFDGTGTTVPNLASAPPAGTATATITGAMSQGSTGKCGTALVSTGVAGAFVNTGWVTNMNGPWTISFWLGPNQIDNNPSYLFGDASATSFRCFYGGAALTNNMLLRGGTADVLITGVNPGATFITIVYNGVNTVVYKNGGSPQTYAVTFSNVGAGPFRVGAYTTGASMNGRMDEFGMYTRALNATEVLNLFTSCPLGGAPCPANITVNNTPNQCGAIVTYTAPIGVDNCPGVTTTQTTGLASGSFFPVGTTTNTYVATDASGNSANCVFTVTVNDVQAPVITCPANITVNTPVGQCTAVVNYSVTATDNCPGFTIVQLAGLPSGGTYPIGTTLNTWRVTDASGNQATCSFTITVNDIQLPVISAQPATQTKCLGDNATFSVTSTNALTYQWQRWNGSAWVDIAGATGSTYTVNNVSLAMNANTFRVRVIGLCTTVISSSATLYVENLPTITLVGNRPPVLLPGDVLTITGQVTPSGGTFEWFRNGVAQPQLGSGQSINVTVDGLGSWTARYTDPNGCIRTSAVMLVSANPSDLLYVYPNPNNGFFHARFYNLDNEDVTVIVYDAKGARVYQQKLTTALPYTEIDIDLNRATSMGIYLVEVRNAAGKRIGAKRILVQHP